MKKKRLFINIVLDLFRRIDNSYLITSYFILFIIIILLLLILTLFINVINIKYRLLFYLLLYNIIFLRIILLYLGFIINNYIFKEYLLLPEIIKIITTDYKPAVFLARLKIRTILISRRERYIPNIITNNL